VEVSHTETCARDVHGEERLGATGEVLDVTVSTVFRASRDCACTFSADLFCKLFRRGSGVDVSGFWEEGDVAGAGERGSLNEL
jgi:hypothetical protein